MTGITARLKSIQEQLEMVVVIQLPSSQIMGLFRSIKSKKSKNKAC
jgi:hypothetical protein